MDVRSHYNDHLASVYSWMTGDLELNVNEFSALLEANKIYPSKDATALDMGCAHGIQSIALARAGFEVKAIDLNNELLCELIDNAQGLEVTAIEDDIRNIKAYTADKPQLISCCGDTITHLADKKEAEQFVSDAADILAPGGWLILSFRDYSVSLDDTLRFIPVKSTKERIFTCFLEYFDNRVRVTDILQEKEGKGFTQKVSSYFKVRLSKEAIITMIEHAGLKQSHLSINKGMISVISRKT